MERPLPDEGAPEEPGFLAHLRSLIAAIVGYFGGRIELAGIEAREALVHFVILALWIFAAAAAVFFGYGIFCIGLVFIVASLLHVKAMWVALVFGLLHFAFAAICGLIVRVRCGVPLFAGTLNEFKKDQEWLSTPPPHEKRA